MDYYVLLNKDKKIISSVFEEDKEKLIADESKGEVVQKKSYDGCPHFYSDVFEL